MGRVGFDPTLTVFKSDYLFVSDSLAGEVYSGSLRDEIGYELCRGFAYFISE